MELGLCNVVSDVFLASNMQLLGVRCLALLGRALHSIGRRVDGVFVARYRLDGIPGGCRVIRHHFSMLAVFWGEILSLRSLLLRP